MKNTDRKSYVLIGAIIVLIAVVFSPVFFHEFTGWDDGEHVIHNPAVRALSQHDLQYIFTTTVLKTYVPLTVLSFALEYQVAGLRPFLYHMDNVLLHLGVVACVFVFALRLGLPRRAGLTAALLFGIHPLHVESVAWISARKDVLYSVFYLLALITYWDYLEKGRWSQYVGMLCWGVLSILAKPMALSLPLILFLLDALRARKIGVKMISEKIPIALLVALVAAVTYRQHAFQPGTLNGKSVLLWSWSLVFYLKRFLIPIHLSPLYEWPQPVSWMNPAYSQAVFVSVVLVIALVRLRKCRWFQFAFWQYCLSIFFLLRYQIDSGPNPVADRFMYLPSLGLCLGTGIIWDRGMTRLKDTTHGIYRSGWAVTILAVVALGAVTLRQTMIWKNDETLWRYVLKRSPGQAIAYNNLGRVEEARGRLDAALQYYERALALKADYEEAHINKGVVHLQRRQFPQALEEFERALKINPESPQALCHRGLIKAEQGAVPEAMADYQRALQINPNYAQAYNNRGIVLEKSGEWDQALADFERALVLEPNYSEAHNNRGNVLRTLGQFDEALASYSLAVRSNPNNAKAYNNRGVVNSQMGREKDALNDYNKAIALKSDYLDAYANRAITWEKLGQRDRALQDYEKVLSINPRYADAFLNRGILWIRQGELTRAREDLDRALEINPRWAEVYLIRAQIYLRNNDLEQARRDAGQARQLGVPEAEDLLRFLEQGAGSQDP